MIAYQLTDCLVRVAHFYANVSREGEGKRRVKSQSNFGRERISYFILFSFGIVGGWLSFPSRDGGYVGG